MDNDKLYARKYAKYKEKYLKEKQNNVGGGIFDMFKKQPRGYTLDTKELLLIYQYFDNHIIKNSNGFMGIFDHKKFVQKMEYENNENVCKILSSNGTLYDLYMVFQGKIYLDKLTDVYLPKELVDDIKELVSSGASMSDFFNDTELGKKYLITLHDMINDNMQKYINPSFGDTYLRVHIGSDTNGKIYVFVKHQFYIPIKFVQEVIIKNKDNIKEITTLDELSNYITSSTKKLKNIIKNNVENDTTQCEFYGNNGDIYVGFYDLIGNVLYSNYHASQSYIDSPNKIILERQYFSSNYCAKNYGDEYNKTYKYINTVVSKQLLKKLGFMDVYDVQQTMTAPYIACVFVSGVTNRVPSYDSIQYCMSTIKQDGTFGIFDYRCRDANDGIILYSDTDIINAYVYSKLSGLPPSLEARLGTFMSTQHINPSLRKNF